MIRAIEGPLIVQPEEWFLVFDRKAESRAASFLAFGQFKHVRAYAYVRFLHVWVFYDPWWRGTDVTIAAEGEPAQRVLASWLVTDPVILRMRRVAVRRWCPPLLGWCVPAIKRLVGIRCSALRCDALFAHCLANGAKRLGAEVDDGTTQECGTQRRSGELGGRERHSGEGGPDRADAADARSADPTNDPGHSGAEVQPARA